VLESRVVDEERWIPVSDLNTVGSLTGRAIWEIMKKTCASKGFVPGQVQ